jgi:hypothetical protein
MPRSPGRRTVVAGIAVALVSTAGLVLAARTLTQSSWPLERADTLGVVLAAISYLASYLFRAFGWKALFAEDQRPDGARCLASCGAAAASGSVLPFRLDYIVKLGVLTKLGGVRLSLEAIGLSIVALGLIDSIALLPLSISATATSDASLRLPLLIVVAFGLSAAVLLIGGARLAQLRWVRSRRRLRSLAERVSDRVVLSRQTLVAAGLLFGCWTTRAVGSTLLLAALGVGFAPHMALVLLCLSAAASVLPMTGGAVANVGASAAVLLALGAGRETAVNFSLSAGLLLTGTALVAALLGFAASFALSVRRGRNATAVAL